ncbi:Methylglutaconyl-CoA hydratase, mitochondrial [Diplodia seriata]|uniref:Methylglutaconyl-CoA hydratase, mitochondrial n=1 Tax=Diplodia seriata TaxID=420778 RepID=A0A1S8BEW2_9PEZI|nr:Methylglutaconyl-CoA hydratase, mitochondrial [Diplodia seriata]
MPPVLNRAPLFARTLLRNVPVNFRASSSSAQPLIKLTNIPAPHSGTIRVLSLNRPEARNAISKALLSELIQHVNAIHGEGTKPTTRALVIASEIDTSFCLRGAFNSLSQLPVPTISAVSSLAFGGGLELALTTHLRVFSSNAVVALPETRLGIIPGAGGTYRLPALVGLNRARDLVLTGRRVGGPEAYFIGLCDRLVQVLPEEIGQEGVARKKVLDEAVRVAMEICEGAPIAIRAALAAVEGCAGGEAVENEMYGAVVDTEDRYEALAAFREKRKPVFKGR